MGVDQQVGVVVGIVVVAGTIVGTSQGAVVVGIDRSDDFADRILVTFTIYRLHYLKAF